MRGPLIRAFLAYVVQPVTDSRYALVAIAGDREILAVLWQR
jgi:hypothetical protein